MVLHNGEMPQQTHQGFKLETAESDFISFVLLPVSKHLQATRIIQLVHHRIWDCMWHARGKKPSAFLSLVTRTKKRKDVGVL